MNAFLLLATLTATFASSDAITVKYFFGSR